MFAEFDHAVLKDDTRFPYVLQCERTKLIDEGKKLLEQYPACTIRMRIARWIDRVPRAPLRWTRRLAR